jgi:CRISPR-associated endonuclease Csn1
MRIFGIDGGIATIGWAILDMGENDAAIVAAGTRTFDAPETDKERTPTNAVRRLHRGQRRVIRRRRLRMNELRRLFHGLGLLPDANRDALAPKAGELRTDPWHLRAQGLDRALTGPEFAIALGHIARHRGFRSNAKREAGANAADETSKMKKGIAAIQDRMAGHRSVGEMFAKDFPDRKHNRGLNFDRSILRSDQEQEVRDLFAAQRRLGNAAATEQLETEVARIAFFQRPLQDSEHMVGPCQFEAGEKCTARRSYAFEIFRLLSRLATLRLTARGQDDRSLNAEDVAAASVDFGKQKKLTWKWLRKTLDLDPSVRFAGITDKDEANDFVARSGNAAEGSYTLRELLGDAGWRVLMHNPVLRDRIAEVLTFREDSDSIREGLTEAGVEPLILDALMHGVKTGAFSQFTRAGHISAKAARKLIPPLSQGKVYSAACEDIGYDHAARPEVSLEDVRNPVARKAVTEMLKQVRAMIHAYGGLPDFIHVELARDIGKGVEERDKISKGIEDRNKQRDRMRKELEETILGRTATLEDLVRYELWKEQNGFCLYTGDYIEPGRIAAGDNRVQVDHILPWSRFGDDSFWNKTLCMTAANQAKKGRTPFEWFEAEKPEEWGLYAERVERCKEMRGRKKGAFYLRKNAKEVEDTFRSRNLNDTRYATRLLLDLLARLYPKDGKRHVLARPGPLTAKLRRAWGLDDLKKDENGKRLDDDRHHALDAIVVAATSESWLNKLTKAAQEAERQGLGRGWDFDHVPPPAHGFRDAVREVVEGVFVSRAERRRARGEAHAATIKQIRVVDGKDVVFERKAIEKLSLADLDLIPVPEPYGKIADPGKLRDELVAELRRWIEAGKPKGEPPLSPKGDVIRKVRIRTTDKVAVNVRFGTADRGDMARVDVFTKENKRGKREFYLVPIYPHEIANRAEFPAPPDRAPAAHTDRSEWPTIDGSFKFQFSLFSNSLVEAVSARGEIFHGYFKGFDIQGGNITVARPENPRKIVGRPGAKTLVRFRKLSVDRLGITGEVKQEVRTWHGEVCT